MIFGTREVPDPRAVLRPPGGLAWVPGASTSRVRHASDCRGGLETRPTRLPLPIRTAAHLWPRHRRAQYNTGVALPNDGLNPPAENSSNVTGTSRPEASSLLPEVYAELRALAAARLRGEAAGHTLQPTALVHEVYLKLARQSRAQWKDTGHFFAVAAQALRRVLVDHARGRRAAKRGGLIHRLTISTELDAAAPEEVDLLALDEVLEQLARLSPRQAQIVEMRFFAGMEVSEVARVLGVSESTVKGEWRMARAWLQQKLSEPADGPSADRPLHDGGAPVQARGGPPEDAGAPPPDSPGPTDRGSGDGGS